MAYLGMRETRLGIAATRRGNSLIGREHMREVLGAGIIRPGDALNPLL